MVDSKIMKLLPPVSLLNYLSNQTGLSCLGSRTPGVKDTPFLGSVWGAKEAGKRLPPGELRLSSRYMYKQATAGTQEVYPGSGHLEANSPTTACLD